MAGFTPERPKPATPDGFRAAQGTLTERAAAYWSSGDELEQAEVLVAGEVTLDGPPLDLVDLLHHLGVTVADDRNGRDALARAN